MIHFKGVRNAYLYSVLLFAAFILVSCCDDFKWPTDPPPVGGSTVVYISGTGRNQDGLAVATYWKNGVPVNLAATHPTAFVHNSSGFGMAVSGTDVYVCGVLFTSQGSVPVYWKNGVAVFLPGEGQATAIAVSGTDVYVAGTVSAGNGYSYGVIWKNGVAGFLTEGTTYSSASALLVSNQNVYVGGYLVQDDKTYATYWKNGTPHVLTTGDTFGYVQSLALVGETLYAAGPEFGNSIGKYWKNDQVVNLTDGSSSVMVTAVYTKGTDVYVAGKRQNGASWELVVWKNNTIITTTPMSANEIEIAQMAVAQNNVLVTGSAVFVNENSSIYVNATLWTNGAPATLSQGGDGVNVYFANSIVVK